MKFKIQGKHRFFVRALLVLIPLLSIALSFFSLPLEVAVPVSIAFTIIPFVLDRFVFIYGVLHVMPMPTQGMLSHRLGTSWFTENTDTIDELGFVIIFKYKDVAKEAYDMFKAWNYGKVIDASENIAFRAIREGDGKYSVFVYPGDRTESLQYSESLAKEIHGPSSHINVIVAKFYMQFCFDYSSDELKTKCIESMPYISELLFNVGYVEAGEVKTYSKRGFRLKNFIIRDRSDSKLGEIERRLSWDDPTGKLPEINQSLVEKVNKRLQENT
ncbi:hypothetical protein [Rheinheimera faecalis]|uniref:hypothetical protein n=1 Tax=Rheinheimera faecalis TaxID=2901141 RepID=UPI001E607C7B|nr:hypothetical protein [Rheinheimera faecalis]